MSDEHHIRADEDIVPHLRLEKRLLTWRAADDIERLTAELAVMTKDRDAQWRGHCAAIAERDAMRALLQEAREYTGYAAFYGAGDRIEADHAVDLCARIDAALNKGGGDEG